MASASNKPERFRKKLNVGCALGTKTVGFALDVGFGAQGAP